MKDYYKILGVIYSADKNEIQKAYRKLARKYHPDANVGDTKFDKIFLDVKEAYEVLKDDNKRKEYDITLSKSSKKNIKNEDETIYNTYKKSNNTTSNIEFDINNVHQSFESFFGFNAKTGEVTNKEKLKNKNPLDTSNIFENFIGFKK